MAGFDNDVVYANNADFSVAGAGSGSAANGLQLDGQLWTGSTAANVGGTHVNVGNITSPGGTINVGYASPNITLDLSGGGLGIDSIGVQSNTPPGTDPVLPDAGGKVDFQGRNVAAHLTPVEVTSTVANTVNVDVQISTEAAASDLDLNGLSHYNNVQFSVDADGFVESQNFTITAGTGLSGGGALTLGGSTTLNAVGGGVTWSVVTVNATFAVNTGTIANKAGTLAMALPAASAVGDVIRITGINTALGWQITQAAGQQIFFGNTQTTLGATGTLTSAATRDSLEMVCVVANTTWNVLSSIGNISVV